MTAPVTAAGLVSLVSLVASARKVLADADAQGVMNLDRDLTGAFGMLVQDQATPGDEPAGAAPKGPSWVPREWAAGFLYSRALTIGGGTSEVQRNIVGERRLGLPTDAAGDDQEARRASK